MILIMILQSHLHQIREILSYRFHTQPLLKWTSWPSSGPFQSKCRTTRKIISKWRPTIHLSLKLTLRPYHLEYISPCSITSKAGLGSYCMGDCLGIQVGDIFLWFVLLGHHLALNILEGFDWQDRHSAQAANLSQILYTPLREGLPEQKLPKYRHCLN